MIYSHITVTVRTRMREGNDSQLRDIRGPQPQSVRKGIGGSRRNATELGALHTTGRTLSQAVRKTLE